jgi:hypothetical protein
MTTLQEFFQGVPLRYTSPEGRVYSAVWRPGVGVELRRGRRVVALVESASDCEAAARVWLDLSERVSSERGRH